MSRQELWLSTRKAAPICDNPNHYVYIDEDSTPREARAMFDRMIAEINAHPTEYWLSPHVNRDEDAMGCVQAQPTELNSTDSISHCGGFSETVRHIMTSPSERWLLAKSMTPCCVVDPFTLFDQTA